jgi:hypothetical protein
MVDDNPHRAAARRWVDCAAADLPPDQALQNFEAAFAVLWQRANRTLSDVTLMAILDRVLYDATERFPLLSPLEIEPSGLRCTRLRAEAPALDPPRLLPALEFVIAEFLTVLGSLVAEILTPALHAELAEIAAEQAKEPVQPLSPAKEDEEGSP